MQVKELWLNLPVKDLARTKTFFQQLGFSVLRDEEDMVGFSIGEKSVQVMMIKEKRFKQFVLTNVCNAERTAETLISFSAESTEHVDAMAENVKSAGGTILGGPDELDGWMYGFMFQDLDWHRWNMVFLDLAKLEQLKTSLNLRA